MKQNKIDFVVAGQYQLKITSVFVRQFVNYNIHDNNITFGPNEEIIYVTGLDEAREKYRTRWKESQQKP